MERKNRKRIVILIFIIILLLSLGLRFFHVYKGRLWADEIEVIHYSVNLMPIIQYYSELRHPPLYFLVLHQWTGLFGIEQKDVKLLSVIFGTASILFIYLISRKMFGDNAGLISAALLSVSTFHIFYSQEVKNYSFVCLLALISFYYYLELLEYKNRKNKVLYVISSILLTFSHVFGYLMIIIQNIHYLILNKKFDKEWIITQVILFVSFIPIIALWIRDFIRYYIHNLPLGKWMQNPTFLGSSQFSLYNVFEKIAGNGYLLAFFAFLIIIFLVKNRLNKEIKTRNNIMLLLLWFLFPILTLFLYSLFLGPFFILRFFLFCAPAFYILLSVSMLNSFKNKFVISLVLGLLFIFLIFNSITFDHNKIIYEEWDKASKFIIKNANDYDLIIVQNEIPFSYYYSRKCFLSDNVIGCLRNKGIYSTYYLDYLRNESKIKQNHIWFISNMATCKENKINISERLKMSKNFGGVNVCYYD